MAGQALEENSWVVEGIFVTENQYYMLTTCENLYYKIGHVVLSSFKIFSNFNIGNEILKKFEFLTKVFFLEENNMILYTNGL